MEKTGCKIICGAPTTLAVKGLMMMMMMMMMMKSKGRHMIKKSKVNIMAKFLFFTYIKN